MYANGQSVLDAILFFTPEIILKQSFASRSVNIGEYSPRVGHGMLGGHSKSPGRGSRINGWSCSSYLLRRRNTRYKNPQLGAQHCFVASFGRCFPFFTLGNQLDPQQKHLLRVERMQRSDWLICLSASKLVARQVVSLMKNEQQSQNLFHKVDPRSTFCNNFLQPETNVFVAQQVDYARWKTGNIDQNLQRNNVAL